MRSVSPGLDGVQEFREAGGEGAINYPAHDFHRDDKLAIAADPYDTAEKAKIFTIDFAAHGCCPFSSS